MNFYIRTSLISFFFLLIFFQTPAQEEKLSVTEWYQNFFDIRSKKSVEALLKENADQRLAAIEISDDSATVFVLIEKGLIHLSFNQEPDHHEKAMDSFIEALAISDSANFAEGRIFTYLALARLFQDVGNNEKSFQLLQKAVDFSDKLKVPLIHALVLKELGRVNAALNKTEDALKNYEDALAYRELEDLPRLEADILFNLASVYETNREYAKALDYHKRSLALRRSVKDRLQEAFLLNEIGEVYQLMNNYERALANFTAALDVYQSIDNKKGIADAYNNIGVLYYSQNNFKQAINNFQLALPAGRASRSKDPERRSYDYLSLSYKALGDYKNALENRDLFVTLNDFMQKDATDQRLIEKQNQSVIAGKETKIGELESIREKSEREIAEQKRIQFFLFALIGLAAIIVLLILYFYLSKRKSNKQLKAINEKVEAQNIELQNLNATKDKFFSIIGHDLKGPLNSLTSFSNLLINYFDSLSKEEIQTLAKDLDKSLKNLHSLLNNLLEWARSQTGKIEFTSERFDISTVLQENYELLNTQAATKQITILYENPTPLQVIAHKQSITTVVRNLISNSIKFTPPGGAIRLSAIQMNTEVVVSITDNGVGMSEGVIDKLFRIDAKHSTIGTANEKGTGLGLILCKDFIEKNGGRLWVTSEEGKGSVFYFTVPFVA